MESYPQQQHYGPVPQYGYQQMAVAPAQQYQQPVVTSAPSMIANAFQPPAVIQNGQRMGHNHEQQLSNGGGQVAGPIYDPSSYLAAGTVNGNGYGGKQKWFPLNTDELRYATVKSYKDQVYVGIRQLYWEAGELRFGRTGINLRLSEWKALLQCAGEIEAAAVELEQELTQQYRQQRQPAENRSGGGGNRR